MWRSSLLLAWKPGPACAKRGRHRGRRPCRFTEFPPLRRPIAWRPAGPRSAGLCVVTTWRRPAARPGASSPPRPGPRSTQSTKSDPSTRPGEGGEASFGQLGRPLPGGAIVRVRIDKTASDGAARLSRITAPWSITVYLSKRPPGSSSRRRQSAWPSVWRSLGALLLFNQHHQFTSFQSTRWRLAGAGARVASWALMAADRGQIALWV